MTRDELTAKAISDKDILKKEFHCSAFIASIALIESRFNIDAARELLKRRGLRND